MGEAKALVDPLANALGKVKPQNVFRNSGRVEG